MGTARAHRAHGSSRGLVQRSRLEDGCHLNLTIRWLAPKGQERHVIATI